MRTRLLLLGACVLFTSACALRTGHPARSTSSVEYAGVYLSTPEEDYFTRCDFGGIGETWSLRFRDDEPHAPFLKKASALRGLPPLTHFIRVRGRLGPPGRYNVGFQIRELAVDSVIDVKETLEPCVGFGAPAAWDRMPPTLRNSKGIAMTADRRLVAVIDVDGGVSLWSTETGALLRKLGSVAPGDVTWAAYGPIAFSEDGTLLAAGGRAGPVSVWRTRDGSKVFSLEPKDSAAVAEELAKIPPRTDTLGWKPAPPSNSYTPVRQMAFNKSGTMLATTNLFSTIVWSMKTGKKLAEFNIGTNFHRKVFFVEDDGLLMTADSGRVTLRPHLDAAPRVLRGTGAPVTDYVAMSPDGRTMAVASSDGSVFIWSVAKGPERVLHVPGFVTGVMAFSPNGKTIAIAGGMSGLYLYDLRTGAPVRAFYNFARPLSGAWFSADGKSIVTISTFDDRFRIVYVDPIRSAATEKIFDDSLTARLPLGPPPSTAPRTIGGIVRGPNQRSVPGAEVEISDGDAPDSVIARAKTSSGGYFSFDGIRFRHVLIRVSKEGFANGVKYIHLNRWANDGPWGIELTSEIRPAQSGRD